MDVVKEDLYGWCERRLVRDSVRWRHMACCGNPWWEKNNKKIYIYLSQKYSFYIALCKLLGSLSWLRLLTLLHVMGKALSWANSVAAVLEKLLWQQFWIIEPCFYIGTYQTIQVQTSMTHMRRVTCRSGHIQDVWHYLIWVAWNLWYWASGKNKNK